MAVIFEDEPRNMRDDEYIFCTATTMLKISWKFLNKILERELCRTTFIEGRLSGDRFRVAVLTLPRPSTPMIRFGWIMGVSCVV
jgi:hypothetical protein